MEVSALLVHIGAVTLPGTTAEKLYAGSQLDASEQVMVERVPAVTRRLLANIPRLEGVLEILESYQRPFAAAIEPDRLPVGARMLRIALDFDALEAVGTSAAAAQTAMSGRAGVYDPELLAVLASIVGADSTPRRVLEIGIRHLRPGMTLADDLYSTAGSLVVARGQGVTDELIERLANLGHGFVREPFLVLDCGPR